MSSIRAAAKFSPTLIRIEPYVALSDMERGLISARTKAGLAAARARGVKLGNPNGAAHLRDLGNESAIAAIKIGADARAVGLSGLIASIRADGITSANGISRALNAWRVATPRGGAWTARSVLNVLQRLPPVTPVGRTETNSQEGETSVSD